MTPWKEFLPPTENVAAGRMTGGRVEVSNSYVGSTNEFDIVIWLREVTWTSWWPKTRMTMSVPV